MKFVVGIGNPGNEYDRTRHNVGFAVLDALARGRQARWERQQDMRAFIAGLSKEILLIKPATFVNRTGDCLSSIARRHESPAGDFLLVCDDVNLDFGKLRLRNSGSAGGHHGLESVIESLGSEDFPRLRIGVGNAKMPEDLTAFVLERFAADEDRHVTGVIERAALICEAWAQEGFEAAERRLSRLQSVNKKGEVE